MRSTAPAEFEAEAGEETEAVGGVAEGGTEVVVAVAVAVAVGTCGNGVVCSAMSDE